jgi:hypothetical protein
MLQERLFEVAGPARPPQHYALLLSATGQRYGHLSPSDRGRIGAVANRLRVNGIAEGRITEEGARLCAGLGRPPTVAEICSKLLG